MRRSRDVKQAKQKKTRRVSWLLWIVIASLIAITIGFTIAAILILDMQGTTQGTNTLTVLSIIIGVIVGLIGLLFSILQWSQTQRPDTSHTLPPHSILNPTHDDAQIVHNSGTNEYSLSTKPLDSSAVKKPAEDKLLSSDSCQIDWGEAPEARQFYGRESELMTLKQWTIDNHCRVVAIWGIGGIGKTCLVATLIDRIKDDFSHVFWRSLQNAPPLENIIEKCILFFSDQMQTNLPEDRNEQLALLIKYMREKRCLLILDNVETILQSGNHTGQYLEGYEDYGKLIQLIGEVRHQSCLLLTSREKLKEVLYQQGTNSPTRAWQLSGLVDTEGREILKDKGLSGSDKAVLELIRLYSGNPLALKLVSETVREVFNSDVSEFLYRRNIGIEVQELLDQQFKRLSTLEQKVMYWLAIERENVSLDILYRCIDVLVSKNSLPDALASLRRRSMVEANNTTGFVLQPVIMEYVIDRFVKLVSQEIISETINVFSTHALMQAQAKDYIRESQIRIILAPIVEQLHTTLNNAEVEVKLKNILSFLRKSHSNIGYSTGNILNLLVYLKADLRGYDFSHLTIWDAYLQGVNMPNVDFSSSHFARTVFTDTFGGIFSIALSPDGSLLAAGNGNGEIRLWQVANGLPLRKYNAHASWIWFVAFSPDGKKLVSSCEDQTVCLWDVDTGQNLATLRGHSDRIRSATFNPDGKLLASGCQDNTVRLWDISSEAHLKTILKHESWVYTVAFSPDGSLLASGNEEGKVLLWDVSTEKCIRSLQMHTSRVYSIAFSKDGHLLVSGSSDHTLLLWDVSSGNCLLSMKGHTNRVRSVAFSPDGTMVVSGSEDQTVRLWEVHTGRCLYTLCGHTTWVRSVAFSPDGTMVASGSEDQTIRFWDVSTGLCLTTLQGHINPIWSVSFSFDGHTVASGSEDGIIRLWDAETGCGLKDLKKHTHSVWGVAFSPDGKLVASCSSDQAIYIWEVSTGLCLKTFKGHSNCIWCVTFSPDGKLLASASDDQTIRLWEVSTEQCLHVLKGHTNEVRSVTFSHDNKLLASGSEDQTIRLWEVSSGHCLNTLSEHTNWVRSVAFNPDDTLLISASDDQTVRLWEVSTGHCLMTVQDDASWVYWATFSPDGRMIASANGDHTIRLWDVNTWKMMACLRGHTNRVRAVAFSNEGNRLVSGSEDGMLILWDVSQSNAIRTFKCEAPYEGVNITDVKGLTEAQKATLKALGAIEKDVSKPE